MKQHSLRIIPLGGLGEVGRNMMVYEYGGEILIVDTGLMFPENDMLGIDYIIPDIQYLRERRQQVRGIVITHGHEDHIGAIHHVLEEVNVPIYATPLTRGLLEVKLARHGMAQKYTINTVQAGEVAQIGPFRVEFFHVCHSIPDSVGLGIQTPVGLIVHTGDYKFDHTPVDNWPTDFAKLAEFSRRGVLALLADSTNSERAGWTPSERVIDAALDQVFTQADGRIIIASFASLVSRMQQVANAAVRHNRKLTFVGPSMIDNAKIARKLGYLELPENLLVNIDQALALPDDEIVLMCTGSQGEPSSILGRLSHGAYRQFDIKSHDTVVLSSHPIPGNEENVYRTINLLFKRGANVLYEAIAPVHVSGHASQEEMKLLINLVRPKFFVPIHGELRQLKQHSFLAQQLGIPLENIAVVENGQIIEFTEDSMELAERVPSSFVFVDGSGVGEVGPDVMREREALSQDGIVLVHLIMDQANNCLKTDPEIISHGFIVSSGANEVLVQTRKKVVDAVAKADGNLVKDVEQAVRTFLYSETHRQPMIFVTVSRL
jgi:ribonuclease J